MTTIKAILWPVLLSFAYISAFVHAVALAWMIGGIMGILLSPTFV